MKCKSRHLILLIGIASLILSCNDDKEEKKIVPPKEIVERMYSKYSKNDPFVLKYEALYSYENDLLQERNTLSDKDKTSAEKLFYENDKLVRTEIHTKHMMLFEEKVQYDGKGQWKSKQTFNTNGEKISELEVTDRSENEVRAKGFIRKSQVRMRTQNQGKDSIMLRQIVNDEIASYQKWAYNRNEAGDLTSIRGHKVDLISPESFEVRNDSLIASFDYTYHFPPNCEDWSLMIAESYYEAKSSEMINRRDSVLRITVSLEDAELTKELLNGFWQVREMPGTSYQFFNDGRYRAYSGSQLAEKGTWNILNSKEKIMFQAIGLKDQKTIKFWNIRKVYKDKITIVMHDEVQSVVRLNKDFTFYKFDNQ